LKYRKCLTSAGKIALRAGHATRAFASLAGSALFLFGGLVPMALAASG